MSNYHLNLTPTGNMYGGGGLYMRPRDALKLGRVYLDGGIWNGWQIVSKAWVDQSVRRHSGYSAEHGYSFAWHLFQIKVGDRAYYEFAAQGNGGQVINVIPELDLAVMFTAGNYGATKLCPSAKFCSP
jgi:CubicO group peptidase (beta-lactamase class C family)